MRAPSQHEDSPASKGTLLPGRGDGISQGKRSDVASGQGEGQEGSVPSQFLLPLPPAPVRLGAWRCKTLSAAVQDLLEPRSSEPHLC